MLLSILISNISNDPSTSVKYVCVCCYLNKLAVMKHWTLDWTDSELFFLLTFVFFVSCNEEVLLYLGGSVALS